MKAIRCDKCGVLTQEAYTGNVLREVKIPNAGFRSLSADITAIVTITVASQHPLQPLDLCLACGPLIIEESGIIIKERHTA